MDAAGLSLYWLVVGSRLRDDIERGLLEVLTMGHTNRHRHLVGRGDLTEQPRFKREKPKPRKRKPRRNKKRGV